MNAPDTIYLQHIDAQFSEFGEWSTTRHADTDIAYVNLQAHADKYLPEILGRAVEAQKAEIEEIPRPEPEPRITPTELRGFNAQESEAYCSFIQDFFHLAEPRITRKWQPIETAPKDGTQVLAWISKTSWSFMAVKWCGEFCGWSMPGINGLEPTHWMPLPSTPAASDGDSNEIKKQGE